MTLYTKHLGTVSRSTVDKLKEILSLLGESGSFEFQTPVEKEVELPVSDDVSVKVSVPNTVYYGIAGGYVSIEFEKRPVVSYKGSSLLSKYMKSISVEPNSIKIDMGWLDGEFDIK